MAELIASMNLLINVVLANLARQRVEWVEHIKKQYSEDCKWTSLQLVIPPTNYLSNDELFFTSIPFCIGFKHYQSIA